MLSDYHVHLRPDGNPSAASDYFTAANVARYREAAASLGIAELGVSEHVYRFRQALDVWQHPFWRENAVDDIDAYCGFVREETDLRLGVEADFVPGREDRMATLLEARDWDYVIGSVHFVGEQAVDHPDWDIWETRSADPEKVWRRYFETLGEAARSGLFDILAHPDLVKVWGSTRPHPSGDLRRFYELALDGIAEGGVAIEVSTAGLRKPVGERYPSSAFLEMCLEAGAPVALSSDAHQPAHVGWEYESTVAWLADQGVRELCVFERRARRLEPIG
jgi:histidinol-phosphatase (PHP family)